MNKNKQQIAARATPSSSLLELASERKFCGLHHHHVLFHEEEEIIETYCPEI
jgi:hypothetical protein